MKSSIPCSWWFPIFLLPVCWTNIWTGEEKIEVDGSGKLSVQVVLSVAVNTLQLKQQEKKNRTLNKKKWTENHITTPKRENGFAFIENIQSDSSEALKRNVNFMIRCLIKLKGFLANKCMWIECFQICWNNKRHVIFRPPRFRAFFYLVFMHQSSLMF